ncbi:MULTISPECIES: ATP-binding protein [unclassified Geodermatophilus]
MGVSVWARRPPPRTTPDGGAAWQQQPADLAALAALRRGLRAVLRSGGLPRGADDGERLLLVVEELASNALRHGCPPVHVAVTAAPLGWLVAVDDAATGRSPVPALDRDPGHGGMGLSVVAHLCGSHGWDVGGDHKTVWARVPYLELLPEERIRTATDRAVALAACLVETTVLTGRTLEALAVRAEAAGRTDAARRYRTRAARAREEAQRARAVVEAAAGAPGQHAG